MDDGNVHQSRTVSFRAGLADHKMTQNAAGSRQQFIGQNSAQKNNLMKLLLQMDGSEAQQSANSLSDDDGVETINLE